MPRPGAGRWSWRFQEALCQRALREWPRRVGVRRLFACSYVLDSKGAAHWKNAANIMRIEGQRALRRAGQLTAVSMRDRLAPALPQIGKARLPRTEVDFGAMEAWSRASRIGYCVLRGREMPGAHEVRNAGTLQKYEWQRRGSLLRMRPGFCSVLGAGIARGTSRSPERYPRDAAPSSPHSAGTGSSPPGRLSGSRVERAYRFLWRSNARQRAGLGFVRSRSEEG